MELFSAEHQYFYDLIADYYDNPYLYKIKDNNNISIYGIQLPSQYLNEKFYLICSVPLLPEPMIPLKEIPWVSFQVRTSTKDTYSHLPVVSFTPKDDTRYNLPIEMTKRNKEITEYKTKKDSVLKISLLHVKGLEYEYLNEGTLKSALDTKQTILQFF